MAHVFTQILLHYVFVVRHRRALISPKWEAGLYHAMGQLFKKYNCQPHIINGHNDHVHCLVSINNTISIADLAKYVKGPSTKYINDQKLTEFPFSWQTGYGCFAHNQSNLGTVYNYIKYQKQHHIKTTFKTEFQNLLKENEVPYEPNNNYLPII